MKFSINFLDKKNIFLLIIFLFCIFVFHSQGLYAQYSWVEPTCDPPDCNIEPPINQSSTEQTKAGNLILGNDLSVTDAFVVQGASSLQNVTIATGKTLELVGDSYIKVSNHSSFDDIKPAFIKALIDGSDTTTSTGIYIVHNDAFAAKGIYVKDLKGKASFSAIMGLVQEGNAIIGVTQKGGIGVWGSVGEDDAGWAGKFDGQVHFNKFDDINKTVSIKDGEISATGRIKSDTLSGGSNRCLYADTDGIIKAKADDCGTGSGSGGVTGTGTTDYFALWTSPTTLGTSTIIMTSGKVGIGTTTPASALHVVSATSPQLRVGYNQSYYANFGVASNGYLTITPSGGDTTISGVAHIGSTLYTGGDIYIGGTTLYIGGVPMLSCNGTCP